MKVLNLRCGHDHRFEGWFASDDEMHSQLGDGRLACPLCGDTAISRLPSAPHVMVAGTPQPAPPRETVPAEQTRQAAVLQRLRQVIANTDDVGERFADEARRIHYGEAEERAIRGQATPGEVRALIDEGIEIIALTAPEALKGTLQ